ncbi:hypothetical protein MMC31_007932 [Peltigera leucophlebia]|nr:hypothetical protein [Peltigera leucophlebia]
MAAGGPNPVQLASALGFVGMKPGYRSFSPYASSGEETQLPSPTPHDNEQQIQDILSRSNSTVRWQFYYQLKAEKTRLFAAWKNGEFGPRPLDIEELARKTVKESWVVQGIWNPKWSLLSTARWGHEEPESEPDPSPDIPNKPRRPKRDCVKGQILDGQAVTTFQREASRPHHQFRYQLSREIERVQNEPQHQILPTRSNIEDDAYNTVRARWVELGIWDLKWSKYPGMSWKHETANDDVALERPHTVDFGAAPTVKKLPQNRPQIYEPITSTQLNRASGRKFCPGQGRQNPRRSQRLVDKHNSVTHNAPYPPTGSIRRSERLSKQKKSKSLPLDCSGVKGDVTAMRVKFSGISKIKQRGKKERKAIPKLGRSIPK